MMRMSNAMLWILLMSPGLAHAHDPGLSIAELRIEATILTVSYTFAGRELAPLIERAGSRPWTREDFPTPALRQIASTGIGLWVETRPVAHQTMEITPLPSDAVLIRMRFPRPSSNISARLEIPLLGRLARGHRQHLTIKDGSGRILGQQVLDARHDSVTLDALPPLDPMSTFAEYGLEGIRHIWLGFDHLLFLLTLLLPAVLVYGARGWEPVDRLSPALINVFAIVTTFTLAHSLTLALATMDIVRPPARLVESVIALSVLIAALNNLRPLLPLSRKWLALVFGLVHGFGFANVLTDLGLSMEMRMSALLGFNLGVELGQMAIVALVFPAMFLTRGACGYRKWLLNGGSAVAATIASVWMFERALGLSLTVSR